MNLRSHRPVTDSRIANESEVQVPGMRSSNIVLVREIHDQKCVAAAHLFSAAGRQGGKDLQSINGRRAPSIVAITSLA